MHWTCPSCGLSMSGNFKFPIYCACGNIDHGIDIALDPEIMEREATCENCPNYMGNQRCKSIEMGCRRAYKQALREGKCPANRF